MPPHLHPPSLQLLQQQHQRLLRSLLHLQPGMRLYQQLQLLRSPRQPSQLLMGLSSRQSVQLSRQQPSSQGRPSELPMRPSSLQSLQQSPLQLRLQLPRQSPQVCALALVACAAWIWSQRQLYSRHVGLAACLGTRHP